MIFFDPEKIAVTVNGPYEAARTAIVDESLQRSAAITLLELSSLHDKDQTEPDADKCIDNIKAVVTDRVYDDPRLFEQLLLSAVEPFKDFMGDLKDHAEEAEPEDTNDVAIEYSGFSDMLDAYTKGLLQALGLVVTPEAVVEEGSSAEYKVEQYSVLNLLMSSAHVFARGMFEPNVFMEESLAESTEPTVHTFLEEAIGRTDINLDQTLRVAAEYVWRHSIKIIGDALTDPDVSDGTKMRLLDSELLLRSSALYSGKRSPVGLIDSMIEAYDTEGIDEDAVVDGDMFDMSAGTYPRPELLGVEANAFNALKLIYTLKSTVSDAYNDPTREQNMGLTDAEKIKAVVTLELIADELNRDPELSDDDIKEIFQEYFGADICTYLTEVIEVDVEKISKSVIIKWGWIDDLSGKAWMNDDDETQESLDDEEFDYRCRYDHDGLNDEYLEDFLLSASDEILEEYDEDHSRDQISY